MSNPGAGYDFPVDVEAKITELRTKIREADHAYYVEANPVLGDAAYDRLLAELVDLERQHPELFDPNSPTVRVGGAPLDRFASQPHARPMLSLENTYKHDDLKEWFDRIFKGMASHSSTEIESGSLFVDENVPNVHVALEPKVDGVAVSLRWEQGNLVLALTRGDGTRGDDIVQQVRTIRNVPLVLSSAPEILEVRGEIFMDDVSFSRLNENRESSGLPLFANARNATAGTLKSLDPTVAAERQLRFVAHGLVNSLVFSVRLGHRPEFDWRRLAFQSMVQQSLSRVLQMPSTRLIGLINSATALDIRRMGLFSVLMILPRRITWVSPQDRHVGRLRGNSRPNRPPPSCSMSNGRWAKGERLPLGPSWSQCSWLAPPFSTRVCTTLKKLNGRTSGLATLFWLKKLAKSFPRW